MEHEVYLRRMTEAKIAQYRKEQVEPRKVIASIDAGTVRHAEPGPNGFMVDCTAAVRASRVARVTLLDNTIKFWERNLV